MPVTKFGYHAKPQPFKHFYYDDGYYYDDEGLLLNVNDPFEDNDVVNKKYLMLMLENLSQIFNQKLQTVNENLIKIQIVNENLIKITKILEDFVKLNLDRKE